MDDSVTKVGFVASVATGAGLICISIAKSVNKMTSLVSTSSVARLASIVCQQGSDYIIGNAVILPRSFASYCVR